MKWFVAMQIVGGKMDDSSKGRTWGKKCKLSNFFLYFCMDFLWIAWTLSTISFYTLRSVCVVFFHILKSVLIDQAFKQTMILDPFVFFFLIFFTQQDNFTTKGSRRHGF
jgi:hypothetical protein